MIKLQEFSKILKSKIFSFFLVLKIIMIFALAAFFSSIFVSCEYYDVPVKSYLEDYLSSASFLTYSMSVSPAATDSEGFPCIGSDQDLVITYLISNPGNRILSAEVLFPSGSGATTENTSFSLSGNSAVLTIGKSVLSEIDGDVSTFNISPTVNLYSLSSSSIIKSDSKSIPLRCNTVPTEISNAVSMMFSDSSSYNENLVVCIELPAEDKDIRYFSVYDHTFDLDSSDLASNGWILYKGDFPLGTLSVAAEEYNSKFEYSQKNGGETYYVLTDISDLLSKELFDIGISVTDKGGLKSAEYTIGSKVEKLTSPVLIHNSEQVSSGAEFEANSNEDYASFTLSYDGSASNVSISYTVTDSSGAEAASGSGSSPVNFELYPAEDGSSRSYIVKAFAFGDYVLDSDEISVSFDVKGSELSIKSNVESSSSGGATEVSVGSSKKFSYNLIPSSSGNLIYSITKDGENSALYSSSDSTNGDSVSASGISFELGEGTYSIEATLKKSYHKDASFSQKITVLNSQESGGIEISTPSALNFSVSNSGLTYTITASDGTKDITSSVSSWNIYVASNGIDITSVVNITVNATAGSDPTVELPSDFAAGTYSMEITAVYNGLTYSGSIQFTTQ